MKTIYEAANAVNKIIGDHKDGQKWLVQNGGLLLAVVNKIYEDSGEQLKLTELGAAVVIPAEVRPK
jgi:hypothetical protein